MKDRIKVLASTLAVAALTSTAMAQITYVDATGTDGTTGNTIAAPSAGGSGTPILAGAIGTQGPGGDGVWDLRAFENGGTIYQNASSGNTDNALRLATTATGLADGTYYVYAYFWSDSSSWRMGASLTDSAGDLPLYQFNPNSGGTTQWYTGADPGSPVVSSSLSVNPFTTDVMVADSNRRLMQINLGQTTVTGGSFTVYIDDDPAQADSNGRTWYDGIGYSATLVPEPTSIALLGLGALLATFAVRRRKS